MSLLFTTSNYLEEEKDVSFQETKFTQIRFYNK